jgi:hypothetical protein
LKCKEGNKTTPNVMENQSIYIKEGSAVSEVAFHFSKGGKKP